MAEEFKTPQAEETENNEAPVDESSADEDVDNTSTEEAENDEAPVDNAEVDELSADENVDSMPTEEDENSDSSTNPDTNVCLVGQDCDTGQE